MMHEVYALSALALVYNQMRHYQSESTYSIVEAIACIALLTPSFQLPIMQYPCLKIISRFLLILSDSLLIVIPTSLTVEAPGSAEVECHYSVCPGLSWQGPAIDTSSGAPLRFTIVSERTTSLLTINPLREEDKGEYYCCCADGRKGGPSYIRVNRK